MEPGRDGPEPGELPPVVTPPPPIEGIPTDAAGGDAGGGPSLSDLEDEGGADSDLEDRDSGPGVRAEGMGAPFGLHL